MLVDVVAGAAIAVAVVSGFAIGLERALVPAGFGAGAVLATRAPLLVGEELRSSSALLIALPAALLLGAIAAALVERFGPSPRRRLGGRLNRVAGALLAGLVGAVVVWILGPVAEQAGSLRDRVQDSRVLARLNSVLEPAGPAPVQPPVPVDRLPTFAFGPPDVPATDPRAEKDPDVRAAVRQIVRVATLGCGEAGIASGWIAADGIVATNAHVVDAVRVVAVRLRGTGRSRPAIPIWLDRRNDIALLRVPALRGVPALPMVRRPRSGTSGAALGFPAAKRQVTRARLGPTSSTLEGRIANLPPGFSARTVFGRLVTQFRGRVRPGNSGGPVVDTHGRVLTTVAAGSTTAGIGVPNRIVRAALRRAGPRVGTGPCHVERVF